MALEVLKPSARSPAWSCATLPIQRQLLSGWYVLSWKTVTGPAVTPRSSNQRMPATPPALTV